ncbi:hypothetical protein GYMLUDRAFT_58718 [Collybiopsis luxurians FD-317 M1]|uniref:TPR-like protein n=1 Tax=Collybiopsis luxurians FD-317 M1 TaxID=944289 RepID=A0A0D0BD94_9AGAR|nr:hypothetical protein GYMLUDRAFT_58718 [Collybiopsis luxurians FD-317 M1]
MSFKKSKLDLLVRVRYSNPLPAPPCPPKLLEIPTNPMRYAQPDFINSIANNTALPMIVDAECGMPLDLGKWESLWEENADDSALNPDPENLPKLDPKDEFLAYDAGSSTSYLTGTHSGSTPATPALGQVAWLRKTEYTSDRVQKLTSETKHVSLPPIDVSREAQLRDIEASFAACNDSFILEELRHPNKPNVTAVESYEILPDSDIWANQYDLFRFAERPGERPVEVEDPRLDCAILRPMKSEHDSFLAYYLTEQDEGALNFKETRSSVQPYEVPENEEPTVFKFIRDYETIKVEQEVSNEYLVVFENGGSSSTFDVFKDEEDDKKAIIRPKGAYYKNIERKMILKKKRANAYEQYDDKWDVIKVTHVPMSQEEEEEREEALAEVMDPLFLMRGDADADADGEVEVDEGPGTQGFPVPVDNIPNEIFHLSARRDGKFAASMNIQALEKCLLAGDWDPSIPQSPVSDIAQAVVRGRFGQALTSSYAQQLFRFRPAETLQDSFDLSALPTGDEKEIELGRLALAVACLHAFLQVNWTGPDLDFKPLGILSHSETDSISEESLNQSAIAELAFGGEPAYHLTRHAILLRLAQLLLDHSYQHCQTIVWWRLRVHLTHQRVLDEPAIFSDNVLRTFENWQNPFASGSPDLAGRLFLEHGLLHHIFVQDKIAAEYFIKAARATDLQYELTGALGKRTKFQQTELSQLVLLAESHLPDGASARAQETVSQTAVPETLALNDDTLLEQTEFTSSKPSSDPSPSSLRHLDPSNQPPLHPLDQCILLSLCLNIRNTSPLHGLTSEQMAPYVARVITHPRNWTIHTMALLLRSRLEAARTRTVERSTLQLQALVDQMPATDTDAAPVSERLRYIHDISLPSKWEMERELADRFISLGVIKSALEIYERLEMWEEVVKCHVSLERPDRGITIVKDLLAGDKVESETVISREKKSYAVDLEKRKQSLDTAREAKLWCILGDLEPEQAVEHYKRAWEVSKHTSGRAMRSLGGYYFARAEYQLSRECLGKAVKINPLLSRSWFILGCACMRLEDWKGAKDGFARCVQIDEEDGESWSNLASMYLRIESEKDGDPEVQNNILIPHDNKQLAFRALKEGLKRSYDNWRMWSNYMIIAVDIGELAEACRALGRVIEETSNKPDGVVLDEEVLDRLVNAVTRAPSDPAEAVASSENASSEVKPVLNPNEGHGLLPRLVDLFERTILPRVSSARVFRAYARLLTWQGKWEETMKAWMDAYRESEAGKLSRGEIDVAGAVDDTGRRIWRDAVGEVEEIVDILRNVGARLEASGSTKKWRLQAKSVVRSFMGRTRENFEDDPEWHRLEELLEELKQE